MHYVRSLACIAGTLLLLTSSTLAAGADESLLVKAESRHFDRVTVLRGADFRTYTKMFLQPAIVTFRSDWLRDMNANRIALLRRTTEQDADEIAREAARGLDTALVRALRQGGYEIAAEPGPGVVTLLPRIENLSINAPRSVTTAMPGRVYTTSAGQATFELDMRDSESRHLLAHVRDERMIGDRGVQPSSMRWTTPASNAFDFGSAFNQWARGVVRMLDEWRAVPVAAVTSPSR
ncbi:MAG: DUF3313 family protein [Burkholderiales bacterium]|nr:DUF3313 family protein [Burkholderiales bacterium]